LSNELDRVNTKESTAVISRVTTMLDGGEEGTFTLKSTKHDSSDPLTQLVLEKENYYDEEIVTLFSVILQLADAQKDTAPWLKQNLRAICKTELGITSEEASTNNEAHGIVVGIDGRLKDNIVEDEAK